MVVQLAHEGTQCKVCDLGILHSQFVQPGVGVSSSTSSTSPHSTDSKTPTAAVGRSEHGREEEEPPLPGRTASEMGFEMVDFPQWHEEVFAVVVFPWFPGWLFIGNTYRDVSAHLCAPDAPVFPFFFFVPLGRSSYVSSSSVLLVVVCDIRCLRSHSLKALKEALQCQYNNGTIILTNMELSRIPRQYGQKSFGGLVSLFLTCREHFVLSGAKNLS